MAAPKASLRRKRRTRRCQLGLHGHLLSFLLMGLPHRQGEIAESYTRLPTEDGMPSQKGNVLGRQRQRSVCIHRETADWTGNRTGQPEFAARVKEDEDALPYSVSLAAGPHTSPFVDCEFTPRSASPQCILDMEGDGHRRDGLCIRPAAWFYPSHGAGKDDAGRANQSRQSGRVSWINRKRRIYPRGLACRRLGGKARGSR